MNNEHTTPGAGPSLDPDTANQLLNNVFSECEVVPNAIPLETLESWGNYRRTQFRLGRAVSYAILVLLVLLPLLFFKPTIIAKRTEVESTQDAIYSIQVKTMMPVTSVTATLDGAPVKLEEINSKKYTASIPKNGMLKLTATSLNGQTSVKSYEVSHLDTDLPELLKSYTEDNLVYLVVRDTYSGIDGAKIVGTDEAGNKISPVSYDKDTETVVFKIPASAVTVSIPDNSGNILQLLLSPAQ